MMLQESQLWCSHTKTDKNLTPQYLEPKQGDTIRLSGGLVYVEYGLSPLKKNRDEIRQRNLNPSLMSLKISTPSVVDQAIG